MKKSLSQRVTFLFSNKNTPVSEICGKATDCETHASATSPSLSFPLFLVKASVCLSLTPLSLSLLPLSLSMSFSHLKMDSPKLQMHPIEWTDIHHLNHYSRPRHHLCQKRQDSLRVLSASNVPKPPCPWSRFTKNPKWKGHFEIALISFCFAFRCSFSHKTAT